MAANFLSIANRNPTCVGKLTPNREVGRGADACLHKGGGGGGGRQL